MSTMTTATVTWMRLGWVGVRVVVWVVMRVVGVAVALPSAPGFFGVFHAACRLALVGFGVPKAEALATGTLIHAVMWLTLTGLGLGVLWLRRTSLGEIDRAAESDPSA